VAGLALLAFTISLVVRGLLLPLGSGDADEAIYVYQAHLLQAGEVTISASEHEPFFRPWLTGARDDRLFFQYGPGWPAVLAASDWVLQSTDVGVALVFAALVVAVHLLALEAVGSRRTALLAAALTVLTPMLVWQSAMHLSYLFTTLLLTLALFCALRTTRSDAWVWPVGIGLSLGMALLTRPFDAALGGGLVVLAVLLVGGRSSFGRLVPRGVAAAFVASPFAVVALAYNRATTGSFHRFPLMASDPLNRFGFGERRMQIGAPMVDYTADVAWESLVDNVGGGIGWLFGGFVAIVLAGWAATFAARRAQRLTLVAMVGVFPVAYFFWWATALSADTATNGIGPHYYVPAFVPMAILSADGLARLSRHGIVVAAAIVGLMTGVTAYSVVDKVDDARWVTGIYEDVEGALPDDLADAIVFVRTPEPTDYLLVQFPFLMNGPDLDDEVLYAVDRGPENARLVLARPERQAYLLHQQLWPGDELLSPRWGLTPLWSEQNGRLTVRVRVPPGVGGLRFDASTGGQEVRAGITGPSGSEHLVDVTLATGAGCTMRDLVLCVDGDDQHVIVGVEREDTGERWERHYGVLVVDSGSYLLTGPGTGVLHTDLGNGSVQLRTDVSAVIDDASRR
jgi:hypothetical protein